MRISCISVYGIFCRAAGQSVKKLLNLPCNVALFVENATTKTASGLAAMIIRHACEGRAAALLPSCVANSFA